MSTISTKDGTQIYYKDWGSGQPVVLSHGLPLCSDSWEAQMVFLGSNGYRCIAHDRRGHGRSSQPWNGNEMNTYADDLATLMDTLGLKDAVLIDFSAGGPFFGYYRPGAKVSQGMIDRFWLQGMQAGHKNTLDCIKAFSETDFTEDLKKFDAPTLIIHGDDDQIVPIGAAAPASSKLIKNSTLKIYKGAPHGLIDTHKEQLNADLLSFLKVENKK
jgi:pimeloyl-ACP methyl ester carboxylesterase